MGNFQWLTGPAAGIILMLIIVAGVAIEFVIHPYVKKVTNTYWWWLGVAILVLIYYISCRFSVAWRELSEFIAKNGHWPDGNDYNEANLISRAFMFDFCPFFGLLCPILLICDPTRKLASFTYPILMMGCSFTIFVGFPTCDIISLDPSFVFVGPSGWQLYVGLHAINMWLAFGIMLNTPKLEWRGYIGVMGFVAGFIAYVLIGKFSTHCYWHTSGLSMNDWSKVVDPVTGEVYKGTYYTLTQILGGNKYLAMGLAWPLELCLFGSLGPILDHTVKNVNRFKYGNVYSKKWWAWYDHHRFHSNCNIFGISKIKVVNQK